MRWQWVLRGMRRGGGAERREQRTRHKVRNTLSFCFQGFIQKIESEKCKDGK